jgi:dihydrofolate reductase
MNYIYKEKVRIKRKSMRYYMIAATCSNNNGIGNKNELVWHIEEDMQFFREMTSNNIIVMGKKTYFSIPENRRPLKSRMNIVVTSTPDEYTDSNHLIFAKIEDVLDIVRECEKEMGYDKCFIIGGESIYRYFLDKVDNLFLTRIHKDYVCDKFFPPFEHLFHLEEKSLDFHSDRESCDFTFEKYRAKDE